MNASMEASLRDDAPGALLHRCADALAAVDTFVGAAQASVVARVMVNGTVDPRRLDHEQAAAHGLSWQTTYATALQALLAWATRLEADRAFGELERLILQAGFGEYLNQLVGGIPMSQGEMVRPSDLGIAEDTVLHFEQSPAVAGLRRQGWTPPVRERLVALLAEGATARADDMLADGAPAMIREQFGKFADRYADAAQGWHRDDTLIPDAVIGQLAALGVFGLTVPEEYGGLGLGKLAMCVVTEELSRGYLGLGSLGTRAEIAAELIRVNGTEEQRRHWLPRIASGEILPTAVFTEPSAGSDLGSLRTRAVRDGDVYRITGSKTWITHGARSDLMTLLARTDAAEPGHRGLSMFLAEKPRGTDRDAFPAPGMSGSEIPVLGYRGMKEYEIGFDAFPVPAANLLGGCEGQGFKQLMETFESARIQTAARAVGVAQNALELGLRYAQDRIQFGRAIRTFPRVGNKLAWMAVETTMARQLTYAAARAKDNGQRCDIEAGMAKLLAARVAWANADNALQIHGGNGYALEYPISRVLCDARILNVFEGAAEIQAQVIVRGLLTRRNGIGAPPRSPRERQGEERP